MCYYGIDVDTRYTHLGLYIHGWIENLDVQAPADCMQNGEVMSKEQIWELEENKRSLLKQAYRMKQENPHMSPVGIEYEMYAAILAEVRDITVRLQRTVEA